MSEPVSESALELPVSAVRDRFSDVVNAAAFHGEITYITRHGKRLAAIVPIEAAIRYEAAHRIGRGSGRSVLAFLERHAPDPEWTADLAEIRELLTVEESPWDDD